MADLTTDCCTPAATVSTTESPEQVREIVRERYASATAAATSCAACCNTAADDGAFGASLYADSDATDAPEAAINASLGCGVPTAVADLHDGETVLDFGSGAGADVLDLCPLGRSTGRAIGLDMTDEMSSSRAPTLARRASRTQSSSRATSKSIPPTDQTVDVIISNCVINLSGDKPRVIRETARVLRTGGRFAVSDVIADPDMDEQTRATWRRGPAASPAR